jgi:hypothetical protein
MSSNPVRAMISRLQTMITTMAALGDDPLILSYFIEAVDVLVEDIRDEVLEVVNAYIPTEGIPEEEEEDVISTQPLPGSGTQTGEGTQTGDTQTGSGDTQTETPVEDPPAENTPVGSEDEDPPVEDPPVDP